MRFRGAVCALVLLGDAHVARTTMCAVLRGHAVHRRVNLGTGVLLAPLVSAGAGEALVLGRADVVNLELGLADVFIFPLAAVVVFGASSVLQHTRTFVLLGLGLAAVSCCRRDALLAVGTVGLLSGRGALVSDAVAVATGVAEALVARLAVVAFLQLRYALKPTLAVHHTDVSARAACPEVHRRAGLRLPRHVDNTRRGVCVAQAADSVANV